MNAANLSAVEEPDYNAMFDRWSALKNEHQRTMEAAWIGTLIMRFDNDELRALANVMSIGEVVTFRRLGLLRDDEGFDGSKESRKRCEAEHRIIQAKMVEQRKAGDS